MSMAEFRSGDIRVEISLNPQYCEDVWTSSNVDVSPIDGKNVYKPGGQVEGTVLIDVGSQPLKFGGIYITAKGYLYVGFNQGETEGLPSPALMLAEKPNKINVAEKHYTILNRQELLVSGQEDSHFLAPGEHQFPFKFDIPSDLPSSFVGTFGFIEYWMEAVIDQTPFGLGMRHWRRDIVIHSFFDIPADSNDLFPVEKSQEGEALNCCTKSETYSYTMVLPKRRYTSEEIVSPSFTLDNQTSSSTEASVKIMKEVTYTAGYGVMKARHLIVEASTVVNPQSSFPWNCRLLLGSNLVPSKTCPHISVMYELQFRYQPTVCQACSHVDLTSKINIYPFAEEAMALAPPIMTEPRTYIHPAMDLTGSQASGGGASVTPPYSEKPLNYRPQAGSTAPPLPVTNQPYPTAMSAVVIDEIPPPPPYSEVCRSDHQSDAPDSSHSVAESSPEAGSQEQDQNTV